MGLTDTEWCDDSREAKGKERREEVTNLNYKLINLVQICT